jgi:hypothetical protein
MVYKHIIIIAYELQSPYTLPATHPSHTHDCANKEYIRKKIFFYTSFKLQTTQLARILTVVL